MLVVDDSSVVRRLVSAVVGELAGFRVVGEAENGAVAVRAASDLRPDIIILDLHMPGMGGMEALREVRAAGSEAGIIVFANVLDADVDRITESVRAAGAELVVKPTGVNDLRSATAQVRALLAPALSRRRVPVPRLPDRPRSAGSINAVVVASSTGGPQALELLLGGILKLPVPLFIVQHISAGFSGRLADQLDRACRFPVVEAEHGTVPEPGCVYLSPGGQHLVIGRDGARPVLHLDDGPLVNSCRPSADVLFGSSAEIYGSGQAAVVLTGIGEDGLDGCRKLSALGAPIIVQDEATSVVWGMPGAVARAGLADDVLPLDRIAGHLDRLMLAAARRTKAGGGHE